MTVAAGPPLYALRRSSDARILARNCSGVSDNISTGGARAGFAAAGGEAFSGAGFDFATGFAAAATFFGFAFSAAGLGFSRAGSEAVTASFGACSAVVTAGFASVAGFFGAFRTVSSASRLVAKSLASASTVSAGAPSRVMR